jgi:hypothetical protein
VRQCLPQKRVGAGGVFSGLEASFNQRRGKDMRIPNKRKDCSFSLIQYVPDLARGEFLNLGVLLHCPEEGQLECLLTNDWRRVRRFHPQADLEFLQELPQYFLQQIEEHRADVEAFILEMQTSNSNLIQVTPPRPCQLPDLKDGIRLLFSRYVATRIERQPPQAAARVHIKRQLTGAFRRAGILERLEKQIPASQWTATGDPFTFDYGYRALYEDGRPNGRVKLIHALSLGQDHILALALTEKLAAVRHKEQAELTAVVEERALHGDGAAAFNQQLLEQNGIGIRALSGVDEYAHSVRRELEPVR